MLPAQPADFYLDMRQFSQLKLAANNQDAAAARAAARQFEGLFVQMMLKNMRAAARFDEAQHSSTLDFYHEMYDRQMAQNLSSHGGIGLGKMLEKQLLPGSGGANAAEPDRQFDAGQPGNILPQYRLPVNHSSSLQLSALDYRAVNPRVEAHRLHEAGGLAASLPSLQVEPDQATRFDGWQSPREFVHDLWPHARDAARQLGVSPALLVAQSALETGWGRHAMKHPDGSIAFNLFGIKAGHDWSGQRVGQSTLEFRDGHMQREQAMFRAYRSVPQSMADYVDFVRSRAHYQEALQNSGDDEHYIHGLHRGGYATDPEYAQKVIGILRGARLQQALAGLDFPKTEQEQEQGHG